MKMETASNLLNPRETNTNALQRTMVRLILGESRDITIASAARVRLGRILWGRDTGLMAGDKPVTIPDEIFYVREDRQMPLMLDDTPEKRKERVLLNLVRAGMVAAEGRLLVVIAVSLVLVSLTSVFLMSEIPAYLQHRQEVQAEQLRQQQYQQYQQQQQQYRNRFGRRGY